jgi:hypothetical protein
MAECAIPRLLRLAVTALAVCSPGGCVNPLNPESGFATPKDPGTLIVWVRDQAAQPVANAWVHVTQPNQVGGEFKTGAQTNRAGTRTFPYIPSGDRTVEVTAPPGYDYSVEGRVQVARVLKGGVTTVTFSLVRQVP